MEFEETLIFRENFSVSEKAAEEYYNNREKLLELVNREIIKRNDIKELIGNNPFLMMFDNHKNHVEFMANVFKFSLFNLLMKIVPWVYKAYYSHGFSYDYFPVELKLWKKAIKKFIPPHYAEELCNIYDFMIKNHKEMITLSQKESYFNLPESNISIKEKEKFKSFLLIGDYKKALSFSDNYIKSSKDIPIFYQKIIQPTLYDIGNLWEKGEISVAEEHLATSIIGRIMANIYLKIPFKRKKSGKVIVTSSPNEYHEIGGRMVADIIESEGYVVHYLGANTPSNDIIKQIKKIKPQILAISVTMPFNIDKVALLISEVKKMDKDSPKIIVGGIVFNLIPDLYKSIDADYWAPDAISALELTKKII